MLNLWKIFHLQKRELYKKLQREDGRYFTSWTDFCLTPRPFGLGRSPQDIAQIVEDHKDPRTLADHALPLAAHGGDRKSEDVQDRQSTLSGKRDASYLTAPIARDCPAVLEEMKAGKYSSVRAAARAAGNMDFLLSPAGYVSRGTITVSERERATRYGLAVRVGACVPAVFFSA